jgi:murein L,D-transpeptidase YcbB/YkuD
MRRPNFDILDAALIVAATLVPIGCSAMPQSLPGNGRAISRDSDRPIELFSAQVSSEIRKHVSSRSVPAIGALGAREQQALEALYAAEASPLWTDSTGKLTDNAREALALLETAAADGLDPDEYGSPELQLLARALDAGARPFSDRLAGFDVALSAAVLRCFTHLHSGRVDPHAIGLRLHVPAEEHDMVVVLQSAVAAGRLEETAAELAPPLVQYRHLRDMLARYRSLAADSTLVHPPALTATVREGDPVAPPGLRDLARWLGALGDLPAGAVAAVPSAYDGPLVQGVKRFQLRHGLEPDGVVGRATRAALAVPLSWRIRQIEMALERLRWLPDLANERVIALNIPMFQLWAWDAIRPDGAPAFTTRAIVGRALRTETPVFVETLREVIFRPYWNVPRSILLAEILPMVSKDPDYLRREAMEIVDGQGDDARPVPVNDDTLASLRQGALRLRQRPGPRNALGLVKFVFPNTDNVYLHSTPSQQLFSRARRDFSHGCVRVEDPVSLAEWVLEDQPGWTRDRIVAAMSGNDSRRVNLESPIQVVLFYLTAIVMPEDKAIRFAEDIYGHDTVLDAALSRRPAATERRTPRAKFRATLGLVSPGR